MELGLEVTNELLLSRQAEIVPPRIATISIAIVGMGGIGSNVFATLARTGAERFTIYDGDEVGPENVWPGAFTMEDVGLPKTEAMMRRMQRELGTTLNVQIRGWFHENDAHDHHDVWIVGTDTMASRVTVWNTLHRGQLYDTLIDARMGGVGYEIYVVRMEDPETARVYQEQNLVGINDQDLPCGQKSTAWLTRIIAGQIAERVRAHVTGAIQEMPRILLFDSDQRLYATG